MKKIKLLVLPIIFSFTVSTIHASSEDEILALRKSYPIQLYMGNCVISRAQPKVVESQAIKMGFIKASKKQSLQYLNGNKGNAWYTQNKHGKFGLATLENGLCSIFFHQGNPEKLQASMESWLPPINNGFSYKKDLVSKSRYLTTTSYKIFHDGMIMEEWIITLLNQPGSNLVAIMSYDTL